MLKPFGKEDTATKLQEDKATKLHGHYLKPNLNVIYLFGKQVCAKKPQYRDIQASFSVIKPNGREDMATKPQEDTATKLQGHYLKPNLNVIELFGKEVLAKNPQDRGLQASFNMLKPFGKEDTATKLQEDTATKLQERAALMRRSRQTM